MLNLIRFTPLSKETHLVAVILGVLAYLLDSLTMPSATALSSFTTAIVIGVSWYLYKVFDGITYDDLETPAGTLVGLCLAVIICAYYFLG